MSDAKRSKIILIVLGGLILGLIVAANLFLNTLQGHMGASNSIEEAKEREIFICEYQAIKNPVLINDTLQLHIERAWLERQWAYPKNLSETHVLDGYQLMVETKEDDLENYSFDWTIGIDGERYFRGCNRGC